jgi:membrane protease YdiL (CAAX protease family)
LKTDTITNRIGIENTIIWVVEYFAICGIFPAILDIVLRRALGTHISVWLNLLTLILFNCTFLILLIRKNQLKISIFNNITLKGVLLAVGCSVMFYIVLDNFIDPFIDSIFTASAEEYREAIAQLKQFPAANFIRICLLAPIVEEILMRGCILSSLQKKHGTAIALIVSSILFAVLHFNFVQTISALICGLVLGWLYINTGTLFCCILAHALYNFISFVTSVLA